MGRIRTIKPEFPHSESMGKVSRDARLLFILLWTLVDDSGRTRAASRMLASLLFPYDDDAGKKIDGWLGELEGQGCIVRYEAEGSHYLQVLNWLEHQRIDRPSPSRIPPFDESSRALASPREHSSLDLDQGRDQGEDQGPRKTAAAVARPDDVQEGHWDDWLAVRKVKVTATALAGMRREAASAGITLDAAVQMSAERGWRAFKADWAAKQPMPGKPGRNALNLAGSRVAHPENMPVPYNSPLGDCHCGRCNAARGA